MDLLSLNVLKLSSFGEITRSPNLVPNEYSVGREGATERRIISLIMLKQNGEGEVANRSKKLAYRNCRTLLLTTGSHYGSISAVDVSSSCSNIAC